MSGVLEDLCVGVLPIRAPLDARGAHQLPDMWQVPQSAVQFATPHGQPAPNTEGPDGCCAWLSAITCCEFGECNVSANPPYQWTSSKTFP